jgi:CAAX protease family protein
MSIMRLRARRNASPVEVHKPWWRRIVPDIDALIPVTRNERLHFAAVAISAGICEEIVFRGWLLFTLHDSLGVNGTTLIVLGALLFGLCHMYQGMAGVFGTTMAGALMAALYVGSGTLLVPIVLHALVDLRAAVLPASRAAKTQTA